MTRLDGRKRSRAPKRLVSVLVVLAATGLGLSLFRAGSAPEITVASGVPGIGRDTELAVRLDAGGRGLGDVKVELVQGERRTVLAEHSYTARPPWAFWGERDASVTLPVQVGSAALGDRLEEGTATLRVEARPPGAWLRKGDPALVEREFEVLLRPPALGVLSIQHYPAQGGAEVVVYSVGRTSVRDGVESGGTWYPGFALPGSPAGQRFALFGVPFDLESKEEIRLVAEDAVGNRAERAFVDRLQPKAYERDRIEVSAQFLAKVVPEIVSNSLSVREADTQLETYISINRDLRARNTAELTRLASESRREFLWSESFTGLPGSQVMSAFADRRTYLFEGRQIDQQDHLGFDLASVKRTPVPAANRGVVVLARYFGIYGNAVVLDHGFGLMSLYGHLSTLEVEAGQTVERGQSLGRTGQTGLAGGDHLHFTMLLQGQAVNPVEWWDASWIRNRVRSKLGPAFPVGDQQ
ncbi:MAG: M23 family metallopeptidase [Thermoanaerobaculia bacterium]